MPTTGTYTTSSTTTNPYVVPTLSTVRTISLLTTGDKVGLKSDGKTPWLFTGVPDGLGAYDNGDGTATVLVGHELTATEGVVRADGAKGSTIDKLIINKSTLSVTSASDLITQEYLWDAAANAGKGGYALSTTPLARMCSGDLPSVSAFYDKSSGLGTQARIYMNGEENGAEGRALATVVTGSEAGKLYDLPKLGNFSIENLVANPIASRKTVVVGTDDTSPAGQVYVWVGNKQSTGTEIEKAGLTNGVLYGVKASFAQEAASGTPLAGNFSLVALSDQTNKTGADLQTESVSLGVTEWLRPEDSAWDTVNSNRLYFNTTASMTTPSRLWALDFVDATNPNLGGKFTALLDGTEGHKMLDNLTVMADGRLVLEEDVGNNARAGRIWLYDPKTDKLTELASHDTNLFGSESKAATLPFNQDEESSGVIDVSSIFGNSKTQALLFDTQAHYAQTGTNAAELVEGGQLELMLINKDANGKVIYDIAPTAAAKQIYSLYQEAFNHAPDEQGLRYWVDQNLKGGKSLLDISKAFVNSAEFKSIYGSNAPATDAFLSTLYKDAFGRDGDKAGLAYWGQELASGRTTPEKVMLDFASSAETTKLVGAIMDYGFAVN